MRIYHCSLILVVVMFIILFACREGWYSPDITVILVRHAEKATDPAEDPPLNIQGQKRALELARMLSRAGVNTIYVSQYRRTRQTARPLAAILNIPVVKMDASDIEGLVEQILSDHSGGAVLVVGHSNTIPLINKKLGIEKSIENSDDDYENLFVLTVQNTKTVELLNLRYGCQ